MRQYALVAILGICVILVGCSGKGLRRAENILESGWARVETEDSTNEPPLYCYRTLGYVECYETPDHTRRDQLVSKYPLHKPSLARAPHDPQKMSSVDYENALARATMNPSVDQRDYQTRMEAYVAAQEQIAIAKKHDTKLFMAEAAAKKQALEKEKKAKESEPVTAQTSKKRTVTDILAVLRGEKTAEQLKQEHANNNADDKNIAKTTNKVSANNTVQKSDPISAKVDNAKKTLASMDKKQQG